MAWIDLLNNQLVTFTDASSAGFTLKSGQSHVTSNQLMTKDDALIKYMLNPNNMSSYVNNQLVPKSNWIAAVPSYPYQFASSVSGQPASCSEVAFEWGYYYSASSIFAVNMTLFVDSYLTIPANLTGTMFYNNGTSTKIIVTFSGNTITNIQTCGSGSGSSGSGALYMFRITRADIPTATAIEACSFPSTTEVIVYCASSNIIVGDILYTNPEGTIRYVGNPNCFERIRSLNRSYLVDAQGVITGYYSCPSISFVTFTITNVPARLRNTVITNADGSYQYAISSGNQITVQTGVSSNLPMYVSLDFRGSLNSGTANCLINGVSVGTITWSNSSPSNRLFIGNLGATNFTLELV